MYFCILRFICIQNYKNASHSYRKSRKNCNFTVGVLLMSISFHNYRDMTVRQEHKFQSYPDSLKMVC